MIVLERVWTRSEEVSDFPFRQDDISMNWHKNIAQKNIQISQLFLLYSQKRILIFHFQVSSQRHYEK